MILQLSVGLFLGALVAILAWRMKALSSSGAVAATLTGGVIFGLGGLAWATLLLTFFITSSLLSRLFRGRKAGLNEKFSKGSQRDYGQVLANGGIGAVLAILSVLFPKTELWWVAFAGAMAAVNADTWATELGVLSRSAPRLITTGKVVERGASGGVTGLGCAAMATGATIVAGAGAVVNASTPWTGFILAVILGGIAGAVVDSLLGASVQAIYLCPVCQKETERYPTHSCGARTLWQRGWRWLNNDWVNFLCSLAGAGIAAGIWRLLQ